MRSEEGAEISHSLLKLGRLRASFVAPPACADLEERSLLRLATQIGKVAIPTCVRELGAEAEGRSRWAYRLLTHLGEEAALRPRVVAALQAVTTDAVSDPIKVRAVALLVELGESTPDQAVLSDPASARRRALGELAGHLRSPEELARAADYLRSTMLQEELSTFLDDLIEAAPVAAVGLIEELLVRDDLEDTLRTELRGLRATLVCGPRPRTAPEGAPVKCATGSHPDGRRVALAWSGVAGRERVLAALLSREKLLLDALYRDGAEANSVLEHLIAALSEQGFTFRLVAVEAAREVVCRAVRQRAARGLRQPRAFYVGRDLFGIHDEHLPMRRRRSREGDLGALLSRGLEQLAIGEASRACALLERYVGRVPRDPEGRAGLGVCLLALGRADEAHEQLQQAAELDPESPLSLWNLAASAHRTGQAESCYRALRRYLERGDDGDGAEERRAHARQLIAEYERLDRRLKLK
jgi:tetratricopeptide (TPR) repeat protein